MTEAGPGLRVGGAAGTDGAAPIDGAADTGGAVRTDGAAGTDGAVRTDGATRTGRVLERAILGLLAERTCGATICPSEAARQVAPGQWRPLMEPARAAARRLVARGEIEVVQAGRAVDPGTAKGPIRLRRVEPGQPS